MTACPIRYQRQVPDRKGKIFYTSITSLSHISKIPGHEAAHGRWRCGTHRYHAGTFAFRTFRVNDGILKLKGTEFDTTRKVNENQQELRFIEHRILTMRAAVSRPFTY